MPTFVCRLIQLLLLRVPPPDGVALGVGETRKLIEADKGIVVVVTGSCELLEPMSTVMSDMKNMVLKSPSKLEEVVRGRSAATLDSLTEARLKDGVTEGCCMADGVREDEVEAGVSEGEEEVEVAGEMREEEVEEEETEVSWGEEDEEVAGGVREEEVEVEEEEAEVSGAEKNGIESRMTDEEELAERFEERAEETEILEVCMITEEERRG